MWIITAPGPAFLREARPAPTSVCDAFLMCPLAEIMRRPWRPWRPHPQVAALPRCHSGVVTHALLARWFFFFVFFFLFGGGKMAMKMALHAFVVAAFGHRTRLPEDAWSTPRAAARRLSYSACSESGVRVSAQGCSAALVSVLLIFQEGGRGRSPPPYTYAWTVSFCNCVLVLVQGQVPAAQKTAPLAGEHLARRGAAGLEARAKRAPGPPLGPWGGPRR